MKSTREIILHTMLEKNRATIGELADAVGINPISVRHHIAKLEADGMVSSEEERHGVGRPRRVYFLTERGMENFPSRYVQFTNRILEQLKMTLSKDSINHMYKDIAARVVAQQVDMDQLSGMDMEHRLNLLKEIMAKEGVIMDWEQANGQYEIKGSNCPYLQIEQSHPEICMLDHAIIANTLDLSVEDIKSVHQGDRCVYIVPMCKP
jgi:DeoR family suf operon transcriptional repressor